MNMKLIMPCCIAISMATSVYASAGKFENPTSLQISNQQSVPTASQTEPAPIHPQAQYLSASGFEDDDMSQQNEENSRHDSVSTHEPEGESEGDGEGEGEEEEYEESEGEPEGEGEGEESMETDWAALPDAMINNTSALQLRLNARASSLPKDDESIRKEAEEELARMNTEIEHMQQSNKPESIKPRREKLTLKHHSIQARPVKACISKTLDERNAKLLAAIQEKDKIGKHPNIMRGVEGTLLCMQNMLNVVENVTSLDIMEVKGYLVGGWEYLSHGFRIIHDVPDMFFRYKLSIKAEYDLLVRLVERLNNDFNMGLPVLDNLRVSRLPRYGQVDEN